MTHATPLPTPIHLRLPDERASQALGRALAALVVRAFGDPDAAPVEGLTMHFSGELGAGKTTVVRALLQHLGVGGRIKSPTYTLVEPYVVEMPKGVESRQDVKLNCYHFDFYRFEDPHEWQDAGFRDYFADAALRLVEWPERASSASGSLLPPPDVRVALAADGPGRAATVSAHTGPGGAWLSETTGLGALRSAADDSSRAG